ncbi:hypothetical protein L0244_30550, partial [bacterium]|nr:hypothetical protein [bacterium]
PDGQHFLYLMLGGKGETGSIYIGSLQGENPKFLMQVNSVAAFAPPENLLFVREQTLMVQRFDPKTFALKGSAAPIAEQLAIHPDMAGFAAFSVSDNGVLAYRSESNISQLLLVDRSNRHLKEVGAPGYYFAQSLSPDATRVAVTIQDIQTHNGEIWIFNLIRGVPTRFTFDPADDQTPFWSPDGKQIVFGSDRAGGTMNLFLQNADSTKGEKLLLKSDVLNHPSDWSSDGRFILYNRLDPVNKFDVWVLPLFGDRVPFAFLATPFGEWGARFSPDVHWIAYTSNETGRPQVYIRPFTGAGEAIQISVQGGKTPRWRNDGKELFFLALDGKIMSVQLNLGTPIQVSPPVALLEAGRSIYTDNQYDVSPDGQRFLINRILDSKNSASVTVVLNWLSDNRASAAKIQ